MKTVFITGGSRGIGLATAKLFASKGWYVGIYARSIDQIEKILAQPEFKNACGTHLDATDRDSIKAALKHFSDHTNGRMDLLVNNAGVLSGGDFASMDAEAIEAMINLNIKGVTDMAQLAFPMLRNTENSGMVNVCSASSIYGVPCLAVYSSTKFYVRALTEALNLEWEKYGIRVTSVKPPYVKTDMLDHVPEKAIEKLSVDLSASDIAEAIYKAAQGQRVGYVVGGFKPCLMDVLSRFFPEALGRRLMKYLVQN